MESILSRYLRVSLMRGMTVVAGFKLGLGRQSFRAIHKCKFHRRLKDKSIFARKFSSSEAKDIINDESVITSKDMRKILKAYVGTGDFFKDSSRNNSASTFSHILSQDDLETRTVSDSVKRAVIPLGDDPFRRDKYLTFYKTVRIGMLLEDMDTLAGLVGYKYYKGPSTERKAPFALVTASVDKFDIRESYIRSDRNIWMTGFVSYAGKTSLEITIHLEGTAPSLVPTTMPLKTAWEHSQKVIVDFSDSTIGKDQENGELRKRVADATFVMVARDPVEQQGVFVNKLVPQTPEEQEIYNKSAKSRKEMKLSKQQSLFKTAPTAEERNIIHDLFLTTLDRTKSTFHNRVKPPNTVWMEQTRLKNLIICHPQSRNVYNKIFGGFLMREAFELGWATTCVHIKSRPSIISMDDINFQKPVEVGSLLYLSSQIVFTDGNYLQTRVHAEVLDPKTGHIDTTNVFHYHFTSKQEFPQVIPMSYGEYMLYLEGRRHAENYTRKQQSSDESVGSQ